MERFTTIELFKEDMKFSAGHFTIFSATEREKLHGHNFNVYVSLTAKLNDNGMAFDYDIYKKRIRDLCKNLGHTFLIAGQSPYLQIIEDDNYLWVHFNKEKIPFPKKDATILPLRNITVEELAMWFIMQLTQDISELNKYGVTKMTIKVFSAPGQCGSASWESENENA